MFGSLLAGKIGYAASCLLAATAILVSGYAFHVEGQVSDVASSRVDAGGPQVGDMNILLMGLESRTDYEGNTLSAGLLAAMHAGSVYGVENEGVGGQATNTLILLHIFAGGQKSRYLMFQPYGMQAYYSTFSTFAPEIPKRFWAACEKKDFAAARDVVTRYDVPFFHEWSHPFWRATMEYFGVAKRYVRPPDRSFTDQQVKDLKTFYTKLGLA